MKFFSFTQLRKTWSVWALSAMAGFSTIDFSTTWLDGVIPDNYKALVYGILSVVGLAVRTIKQPKI